MLRPWRGRPLHHPLRTSSLRRPRPGCIPRSGKQCSTSARHVGLRTRRCRRPARTPRSRTRTRAPQARLMPAVGAGADCHTGFFISLQREGPASAIASGRGEPDSLMAIRNAVAAKFGLGVAGGSPVRELALLRQCHCCCSIYQDGLLGRPDAGLAPFVWILPGGPVRHHGRLGARWSPTGAADTLQSLFLETAAIRSLGFVRRLSALT
jgi:hypothetical protein